MEDIMQYFLDLLQVTGGDLAPEKCAWFLIAFRWKDGKVKMVQIKQSHKGYRKAKGQQWASNRKHQAIVIVPLAFTYKDIENRFRTRK
jgi:hypothetical protein